MTSLKTVLLGSAAGILATGSAQAADLPVKKAAAAVQYVETCPVYGAGFYKLPGTDICVRHFGSVKFGAAFQDARSFYNKEDKQTIDKDVANTVGWQYTIRPGWDFRSPTEYGTLRTVVQLRVDQRNGVDESNRPVLTGAMRLTNLVHRGYIEWAGFLIGRAGSQFVYWDQDDVVTAIGGSPKTTAMQFTYVWNFGGGLKATLGLEDSTAWIGGNGVTDLTGCHGPFGGTTFTDDNFGGNCNGAITDENGQIGLGPQRWKYDVVASLSTEQAWGNAKISGALHNTAVNSNRNGHFVDITTCTTEGTGVGLTGGASVCGNAPNGGIDTFSDWPSNLRKDTWGYAALAGITFNLPMLGTKDQLLLEGSWCNGAVAYCGLNGGAENNMTSFERSGNFIEGIQRDDVDAYLVFRNGRVELDKTKAWSVAAQLRHYWSPLWRTNIMGSYSKVTVPTFACGATGDADINTTGAGHGQCGAKRWDAGINLIWGQSRKTAEIGVEFAWKKVTSKTNPGNPGDDCEPGLQTGGPDGSDTCSRNQSGGNRNPSGWTAAAFIQRAW